MTEFLIRTRDGALVASHQGPAAEAMVVPEGETAERFDTAAEFEARLAGLEPDPGPDPNGELDAALTDAAAKSTVEEKVDAVIAALRGQAGHAGCAAARRPD